MEQLCLKNKNDYLKIKNWTYTKSLIKYKINKLRRNFNLKISVVIPTIGSRNLKRTLDSINNSSVKWMKLYFTTVKL